MGTRDRRRPAVVALALFVVATVVATAVAGSRPASDEGVLPWVVQLVGYLCALLGGVLLLAVVEGGAVAASRRAGAVVVAVLVVLVLLDAVTGTDGGGADIGAGFVRLVGVVTIASVAVAVGVGTGRDRDRGRRRP